MVGTASTRTPRTGSRLALLGLALVAALCVAGVVVSVVIDGTSERLSDWLAVVAVAALVGCWRLYRPTHHHAETD
jgi:integral membrane sensor domain MASE1